MPDMDFEAMAAEAAAAEEAPKEDLLKRITERLEYTYQLDSEISTLEEAVEAKKAEKRNILTKELVDLFDEARADRMGLPEAGVDFVVEPFYSIRLPDAEEEPDRRAEVLAWLDEEGFGDIVKWVLTVLLSKDDDDTASKVRKMLKEHFPDLPVEAKKDIPWKRYESWFKEQVLRRQEDPSLPPLPSFLGGTIGRVVTIKKRKK